MFIRIAFAAFAAALLSACNPMAQLEQSEAKIEKWHATYNEGDARTLYGLTSQEFRDVTSIDEMNQLVDLVTDKMGKVSSSERTGFNINTRCCQSDANSSPHGKAIPYPIKRSGHESLPFSQGG